MDLCEFLSDRIAEDEAPTYVLVPYICAPGCCAPAGWVGSQCRYCDTAPVYGGTVEAITESANDHAEMIHQRSRVLVECEAKRRIVKIHEAKWHECGICVESWVDEELELYPCRTLRALAMSYADHPDYREEWRP